MERLTNKCEADAQREEYERRLANGYPLNIPEERFLRLAAYEDTGLTPDDIDKYEKALGAQFKSLTAMKNKYVAMRNELCQYCGKYKQAHNDACNGCKWREV